MKRDIFRIGFLLLLVVSIVMNSSEYLFGKKKTSCTPPNSPEMIKLIKDNIKIGVDYNKIENEELFRKLLVGEWASYPYSGWTFKADGTCILYYNEFDDNREIKGMWKVERNSIMVKFIGNTRWETYEIAGYYLSDWYAKKSEVMMRGPDCRYTFRIGLKKRQFWGGDLELTFK